MKESEVEEKIGHLIATAADLRNRLGSHVMSRASDLFQLGTLRERMERQWRYMEGIRKKVSKLNTECQKLAGEVSLLHSSVVSCHNKIDRIKKSIQGLHDLVGGERTPVTALEKRMEVLEDSLARWRSEVRVLQQSIPQLAEVGAQNTLQLRQLAAGIDPRQLSTVQVITPSEKE